MVGVAVDVGVLVAVGVAVSVGFGVFVLIGVVVLVGVGIGRVAAQDTLPRAHAPSGQVVSTLTRAIAPLKVFVRSLKLSDPVVPSM